MRRRERSPRKFKGIKFDTYAIEMIEKEAEEKFGGDFSATVRNAVRTYYREKYNPDSDIVHLYELSKRMDEDLKIAELMRKFTEVEVYGDLNFERLKDAIEKGRGSEDEKRAKRLKLYKYNVWKKKRWESTLKEVEKVLDKSLGDMFEAKKKAKK